MSKNLRGASNTRRRGSFLSKRNEQMRNNPNKNKGITESEKEQHSRLCNELTNIRDKRARHAIAGEIVRNMQEFDIGV
jgi:ribosomal protein S17E